MNNRKPYPPDWPAGYPRTPRAAQKSSQFKSTAILPASKDIHHRLKLMKCANVVTTTNIEVRLDGLPYSNQREPVDTGAAVWWTDGNRERVIACDCWYTVGENLRALAHTLDALDGLRRWGGAQIVERAFAGFAALPAAAIELPAANWRDVLIPGSNGSLNATETLAMAKSAHRLAMQTHHPDHGGSTERAAELNRAWAECQKELQP